MAEREKPGNRRDKDVCLFQFVPYLPPSISGVGDFATVVASKLWERHSLETTFLVANPKKTAQSHSNAKIIEVTTRKPASIVRTILEQAHGQSITVLLHYSGYGYQKRSVPLWLLRVCRKLKRIEPQIILIVYFHELFALGKPWQSSFWLSPIQSHIAQKLLHLCDAAVTNTKFAQNWLLASFNGSKTKPVILSPVISNVGEPEHVRLFNERSNAVVVWGSLEQKERIYSQEDLLLAFFSRWGITSLCDIGFPGPIPERIRVNLTVRQSGIVSPGEIIRVLSDCRFGLMNYPPALVTKSGTHAAFCAHGVIPINTWTGTGDAKDDVPLWNLSHVLSGEKGKGDNNDSSTFCKQWYVGHSSVVLVDEFIRLMDGQMSQA